MACFLAKNDVTDTCPSSIILQMKCPGLINIPHFSQGRLVNIHSFSVNTIASVLKKFLRKIPGGIFGPDGEQGRRQSHCCDFVVVVKLSN